MYRLRPSSPQELARILDVLAEAVTVTEADGQLVFANAAALQRMGVKTLEEARAPGPAGLLSRFEITDEAGKPLDPDQLPGRKLLQGKPAEPMLLRLVNRSDGRVFWTRVKASAFENDQGRQLAVNVLEDVTEAKEQELHDRFLSHASEVLASSLDYEQTLRRVAELVVPDLADWCSVDMLEGDKIRQLAVAHVDPAMVAYARDLQRRYPPSLDDPSGLGAVLRTGKREFYPTITDELLVASARDEEHLRIARELQMRSAMVVPMRSRRGDLLGAITFVASDVAGAYDESALAFAEEFASRAAAAVENSRLYQERNNTAETLQRSLLPARLPSLAGWRVATLYRPAVPAGVIGGDFFDIFLTEGGFTVVIGDVTGKGIEAAALTALARHSLRASALLGLSPAASLSLLNRLLIDDSELSLVTAVVARVTNSGGDVAMTLACAGHPQPLRHRFGEPPLELGELGMLLGFHANASWSEQTVALAPGDTVLFYTDGVTDTPGRRGRLGEPGLRELLSDAPQLPQQLLDALDGALDEYRVGDPADDVAMLAAQLLPNAARMDRESAAAERSIAPQ
jgi:serine phosphatase RsbU (regulator of sigma subunit)